ncbi:MAG TPA: 2,3-bisphosphoglycerate-independent phosphoglycerate mutase [Candidatus Saccharimonadales bacterium]|nr:2,3-bisphosphoglycerate-independent phosphoglycerate mutase [Candidatus Saccharimonadales bacterium]
MLRLTQKPKPIVLCILDGWGIAADSPGNAITKANPTNFNGLWFSYPHTYLSTTGQAVGLPEGQVGSSEVGHLNIGAGKIVFQDLLRINLAIQNGNFAQNEALNAAIEHAKSNNSNIHVMGLVGLDHVHSSVDHLFATLDLIKSTQFPQERVKIHLFTDGRDSPPTSGKIYIPQICKKIKEEKLGIVASISGRYYAMDRDNRWERIQLAYQAICGTSPNKSYDPQALLEISYTEGTTDEFIKPTVICNKEGKPLGPVQKNDSIIFFNFRPDRARELTKAFVLDYFDKISTSTGEIIQTFPRGPKIEGILFTTLTQYEKGIPVSVAFPPQEVIMPLSRVIAEMGDRQFHIAETEKYAHVTYFFNGGREQPFPGEDRLLINSAKVASYDLKPEMSTPEVTKAIVTKIADRVYDLIVVNLANADMLGHTGNLQAAIQGIKVEDECLGIITKETLSHGGAVVICADHGNAEVMINQKTGNPDTEHNPNPAPFIVAAPEFQGKNVQLQQGILADVAPTILAMLSVPKPSQMTGRNLLE